jgi:recombination protein RecA
MAERVLTPEEFYKKVSKEDREAIINLKDRKPIEFIPTGSWPLNKLVGDGTMTDKPGGHPRGHITEIFGDESSGKTTMVLAACKEAQALGGLAVFIDFEYTFHPDYAEKLGVDLSKDKFMLVQPKHFQEGARWIKSAFSMKPHVIVVDSVAAMTPREFLEGAVDEAGRIGLQAQLMSGMLSHLSKFIKESNTSLIFTNQLRKVIKKSQYETGPDEESSGGLALKFYSSVRWKLKKSTVEKVNVTSSITGKADKEPINVMIKATVVKNKVDKPWRSAPVFIRFGEGFDNILSIIELAVNTGVIKKSGAFFTFSQNNEVLIKAQGKEQLWKALNENEQLFSKLSNSLTVKEDEQAKVEYAQVEQGDEMDDVLGNISAGFIEKQSKKKAPKEE